MRATTVQFLSRAYLPAAPQEKCDSEPMSHAITDTDNIAMSFCSTLAYVLFASKITTSF
jgi:hypothetical protein